MRSPLDFVIAQVIWFAAFQLTVVRWRLLLRSLGVHARHRDAARLCWIGLFFSQVIPGATGGDVVRGIQIARESPGRRAQAVLSVLLDRTIGLTALMLIGAVGVFFCPPEIRDDPTLARLGHLLLITICCVLVGGCLLLWKGLWQHPRLLAVLGRLPGKRVVGRLAESLWAMKGRRRVLPVAVLLSLAAHGLFILTAYFLARGLVGEGPPVAKFAFLVPLGQLAFSLPLTPGGTGLGEWAYEELFRVVGVDYGGELGVFLHLTSILWALVGAVALIRGRSIPVAEGDPTASPRAGPAEGSPGEAAEAPANRG